jgi:menaquinone-dependent protoporphyrinogen IX oxidase
MLDSILIAYATRYGSTQEVAERIAATLPATSAIGTPSARGLRAWPKNWVWPC